MAISGLGVLLSNPCSQQIPASYCSSSNNGPSGLGLVLIVIGGVMVIGSVLLGLAVNKPWTVQSTAPRYAVVTAKLNPYRLYPGESQTLHLMRTAMFVAGSKQSKHSPVAGFGARC